MNPRLWLVLISAFASLASPVPRPCMAQPCSVIDQGCEVAPGDMISGSTYYYDLVQSFTPSMEHLCAVELYLSVDDVGHDLAITVQIQDSVVPGTGVLSSLTVLHSPTTGEWILFDMPDLIVVPGTQYFIYVSSEQNCMWWASLAGCGYSGGEGYLNGHLLDLDFSFRTYSGDAVPAEDLTWGRLKAVYR